MTTSQQIRIRAEEARAIAMDAYIYGFPIVDNYRVQYSYFVDSTGPEYKAPWNTIFNNARVYTPDDRTVQTPNADTPYSYIGADLRSGPLVLTVPSIEKGRYFSLQFVDMYTFNFAYAGSRTTGHNAARFLLAGPGWTGEKPELINAVIRSETELALVIYRTQLFNAADIDNVRRIQAGYTVQSLADFLHQPEPSPAPPIRFIKPLTPEAQRTSLQFFEVLNFALGFCPTHPSEKSLMERFGKLGIGPSKPFDVNALLPETRLAIEEGMSDAWRAFEYLKQTEVETGKQQLSGEVFGTRDFLRNDYLKRMAGAALGIHGNSKDEAIYPSYFVDADGQKLDGRNRYTMRFEPDKLPPVNAFWSFTLYQLPASLLYGNSLNRYLINSSMAPTLATDDDGALTIHIQNESPGKDRETNWLPSPKGPFFTALRLYWPKPPALDGRWLAPKLERQDKQPVTADNFARAESDMYFWETVKEVGLGKWHHHRDITPVDKQTVVRSNRDTLYSRAVFDLEAGTVTVTMPEAGRRFMSLLAIDEDHYTHGVVYGTGEHAYTREQIGTRYVMLVVRLLADPRDSRDLETANALQDGIRVRQRHLGIFELPDWDRVSQAKVREALLSLGATLTDSRNMFGERGQVDAVRHLIGTAAGWGGNPDKDAIYLNVTPRKNDGKTVHRLTVKEVPVDGFWSISVYNAKGWFEPNRLDSYSVNDITAKKSPDGSVTVQFGACEGGAPNCLPIMEGWNYTVRLYKPRKPLVDGTWTFPEAQPATTPQGAHT